MPAMLPMLAFGTALLCAILSIFLSKGHDQLCFLAALGLVCGVLCGLAAGWTMGELLKPVLILCVLGLLGWRYGKGGRV